MITGEFNVAALFYSPYGEQAKTAPGKTCIWLRPDSFFIQNNYGDIQAGDRPSINVQPNGGDLSCYGLTPLIVAVTRDSSGLKAWTNDFVLPKRFDGSYFFAEGSVSSANLVTVKPTAVICRMADGLLVSAPLLNPVNWTAFYWPTSDNAQFVDTSIPGYDIADATGRPIVGQTLPGAFVSVNQYSKTITDADTGVTVTQNITSAPTTAADPFKPQPLTVVVSDDELTAAKRGIENEQKALANGTALPETVAIDAQTKAYNDALNNPLISLTERQLLAQQAYEQALNPNPAITATNPNPGAANTPEVTTIIPVDDQESENKEIPSPVETSVVEKSADIPVITDPSETTHGGIILVVAIVAALLITLKMLKII